METVAYSQRRMKSQNGQRQQKQKQKRRKVFICSPFRPEGRTKEEREWDLGRNLETARQACRIAVQNGYLPLAPHLYYPQFLSDGDMDERELGMRFGEAWLDECDELWVIGTRVTEGMETEIAMAEKKGIPVINHIFAGDELGWLFDMLFGSGNFGVRVDHDHHHRQTRHIIHKPAGKCTHMDCGFEENDYTRYYDEEEEGLLYDEY